MSAEILTPSKFAARMDESKLEGLRNNGLLVKDACPIDDLELPEPQYGEQIIGTLTAEEAELYASIYSLSGKLEELNRTGASNAFIATGEAIRDKREKDIVEKGMVSEDFAKEFFRTQRQLEYLKSLFFWTLSSRLDCFDYIIGVRSRRRIIKSERRW